MTSYIGIVEPISSGLNLIQEAKEMGLKVLVFTADCGDRTVPSKFRESVDEWCIVDTNDEEALCQAVNSAHQKYSLAALVPGFEYYVAMVSRISEKLGFIGLRPDTADCVRHKSKMRQRLSACGLRSPRFFEIRSVDDLEEAAHKIGFPAVAKADDLSGSVHVSKVEDILALESSYQIYHTDTWRDLGHSSNGVFLLEEYIDGPELSVEGFITASGEPVILSNTQKILGPEPAFVEVGHIVEAELEHETILQIRKYLTDVLHALQVTMGVFHAEIRLSKKGPVLIEIGARLPGDYIVELVRWTKGASLPRAMLQSFLGKTPFPWVDSPKANYAGIQFLVPTIFGHQVLSDVSEAMAIDGVLKCELTLPVGSSSFVGHSDFRSRIGWVIAEGTSHQQVIERLKLALQAIQFS